MKTLLKLFTVLVSAFMLISCEQVIEPPEKTTESVIATVPFNAYFITTFYKSSIPHGIKGLSGPVSQMVQNGSGNDNELGMFTITLTCCWSVTDGIMGSSGGTLKDTEGNMLYITCKENLVKSDISADFPSDQTVICGRFEFTGGTGKFTDATGDGTINCIVSNYGSVAEMSHNWTGTIKIHKTIVVDRPED